MKQPVGLRQGRAKWKPVIWTGGWSEWQRQRLRAKGSPVIEQCRKHLEEAGESYGGHMLFATTVGLMVVGAGLACLVHAVVPALCKHRCSETVRALYRLFENRGELDQVRHQASGAMTFVGLTSLALFAVAPLVAAAPGEWWAWTAAGFAFAIPAVFLSTNPQLEPV